MKKTLPYARPVVLLIAGALIGVGGTLIESHFTSSALDESYGDTREGGYSFINPLLSCDVSEDIPDPSYANLQNDFQREADALEKNGNVKRISVYFRNMDYGNWTGIGQDELYAPASLMKVPVYIAYLHASEGHPEVLTKTYTLPTSDDNAAEFFKPTSPLKTGATYTVQQLLDAMITQSDNNAAKVLTDNVPKADLADAFDVFGVESSADQSADSVSPSNYMRFFRILYNGSYLWKARSAAALDLLSKTTFDNGLVRGVPSGTTVAHKFGERTVQTADGTVEKRELSDCGIVYYPRSPYGICVMAEGDDLNTLADAISSMSQIAYSAVDAGLFPKK